MTAEEVRALAAARPPTLGGGRLVCVDGPAGSGKTVLAGQLSGLLAAPTVHMDDLYPGWDGLGAVDAHVLGVLEPLSRGHAGRYRRFDWLRGEYAEEHVVEPSPFLVLEGVGSGNSAWSQLITVLVWVEADHDTRMRRGIERDGAGFAAQWERWAAQEERLFAVEGTRERADVLLRTDPPG